MSSPAYYMGLFLADIILFNIPCIITVLLAILLDVQSFKDNSGRIIFALFMFSLGFVNLNYLIGFCFKKADTAFKSQILPLLAFYGLPIVLDGPTKGMSTKVGDYISPIQTLSLYFAEIFASSVVSPDGTTNEPDNSETYQTLNLQFIG
jgi:hypothetical protein